MRCTGGITTENDLDLYVLNSYLTRLTEQPYFKNLYMAIWPLSLLFGVIVHMYIDVENVESWSVMYSIKLNYIRHKTLSKLSKNGITYNAKSQ